jgi:3-oxoacyl-[acyl-carrier protein] reductase
MDLNLQGKNALVTGSSRGIGKSIAQILHSEGCNVFLNARNKKNLKKTAQELGNLSYYLADVTISKEAKGLIRKTVDMLGGIDILVCNVGSGRSVSVGNEKISEWKRMLDINFFSSINVIDAALEELKKSKGSIVCISSIAGIESIDAPIPYAVAKAALNSYVKGISKLFAKFGVRINAVAPGNILFEGSTWENILKENPHQFL